MAIVADILSLDTPESAKLGDLVTVIVNLRNTSDKTLYIAVSGTYDSSEINQNLPYYLAAPNESFSLKGTFIMPTKAVHVVVNSWWWNNTDWIYGETFSTDIFFQASTSPRFGEFSIIDYS